MMGKRISVKNVCTQHLCVDNCQLNKKSKQQMFHSRDGKPHGDDNEGKPRKKNTHTHTKCILKVVSLCGGVIGAG